MSEQTPGSADANAGAQANAFSAADVATIARERGWIGAEEKDAGRDDAAREAWFDRAAALLGPQAADRQALAALLALIFRYEAGELLEKPENQAVLMRKGSREVIRALANLVLDGGDVDSVRFQEIVEGIKTAVPYRSRALFHPVRLALAGSTGEGEMDRVILLLDQAARLALTVPVKSTRERMLEFCACFE